MPICMFGQNPYLPSSPAPVTWEYWYYSMYEALLPLTPKISEKISALYGRDPTCWVGYGRLFNAYRGLMAFRPCTRFEATRCSAARSFHRDGVAGAFPPWAIQLEVDLMRFCKVLLPVAPGAWTVYLFDTLVSQLRRQHYDATVVFSYRRCLRFGPSPCWLI